MGGAYGHLSHPFDDKNMTFGDMKQLVDLALQGKLEYVREKTDGQNIMVTWKDGKLRAARNKGHIKNAGKNSLTASGIKDMFAGRGDIEDAFFFAMKDLGKAIGKLNKKQRDEFEKMPYFKNAIKLRKFDELAKKDNIKIKNIDEYKKLLNSQLL